MKKEEKIKLLEKAVTQIKNPMKSWWSGDERVEEFMHPVREAIDRNIPGGNTDIYNRAYEAVYAAIMKYAGPSEASD